MPSIEAEYDTTATYDLLGHTTTTCSSTTRSHQSLSSKFHTPHASSISGVLQIPAVSFVVLPTLVPRIMPDHPNLQHCHKKTPCNVHIIHTIIIKTTSGKDKKLQEFTCTVTTRPQGN